ncbi:MAG: DUF6655 family protein, partial [Schlesneria sp.]
MSCRLLVLALVFAPLAIGCSSVKRTDTARTAREQILISGAVDQSLAKCDFTPFQGARVFVEDKYLDCIDKGYVVGSVRHRLMLNGASIVSKPEDADVVIEMRSGGVGTDNADSYVGCPEIVLPGMLTLPEVRLWQKSRQSALAKIGLVAYDTKTHEMLGAGGVSASLADDTNVFVFGFGPYQYGSARTEMKKTIPAQPGQLNQELPSMVAFRDPSRQIENPDRLQLTSGKREE